MEKLGWYKEILGTRLFIVRGDETIGLFQWKNLFSGKATAEFRGKTFLITSDIIASRLEISDGKDQALLAKLSVNPFNPRSEIIVNGKRFELEMKNFWQSGWSWNFNGTPIISFTSNEFITRDKGDIELFTTCNDEVEILILMGLALRNQFVLIILFLLLLIILIVI